MRNSICISNTTGHFIEVGTLEDVDTDSWNVGDDLYISETGTTTNTLTNVKPTGTALIQKVAVVLRKHASNGVIEIFGAGRENDLPNLANTKIWIGDTNGVPQEFVLSGDASMTAGGVVTIDHVDINNIGTNSHAQIDTHIADSSDPHGATLTQTTANIGTPKATTDTSVSGNAVMRNVVIDTADPNTASNYTIGTIHLKYTA